MKIAERSHEQYSTATPFPHVVFDNFLPEPMFEAALAAFPAIGDLAWRWGENQHTKNKAVLKFFETESPDIWFPDGAMRIFNELMSAPFLMFLAHLTRIKWLIPDPYFQEGGLHMVGDGGKLDPHADFSHHKSGLERRLNLLLYLNEGWKEEYGGHIKLYDTSRVARRSFLPIANRCLIFTTSETSFHGHPEPMKLPAGVMRRSLALYYYTMPTPERERKRIVFQ